MSGHSRRLQHWAVLGIASFAWACEGPTTTLPDADGATVSVSGIAADSPSGFTPLEGVRVCVLEHAEVECDTTDAEGRFDLVDVPAEAELLLTLHHDDAGYFPVLAHVRTGTRDAVLGAFGLIQEVAADALAAGAGLAIDRTRALVVVEAFDSVVSALVRPDTAQPDVSFAIEPADAEALVYLDASGLPSTTLTATTERGTGVFFDVPSGEHTITFDHPMRLCTPSPFAWAGATEESLRMRAEPGYIVNVGYGVCVLAP